MRRTFDDCGDVRPMQLGDVDEIQMMHQRFFGKEELRAGDESAGQYHDVIVAEIDGTICGYAALADRPWRPWTSWDFLAVDSQFAGRGIGRALLRECVRRSRRPLLRLFVRPSNRQARSLYVAEGFRQFGVRRQNYPDGEDALIFMRCTGMRNMFAKRRRS